jgi:hypothetical protein
VTLTNDERRIALAMARRKALEYAEMADNIYTNRSEDGPEANLASMWAAVAIALKVGDNLDADGVYNALPTDGTFLTR